MNETKRKQTHRQREQTHGYQRGEGKQRETRYGEFNGVNYNV